MTTQTANRYGLELAGFADAHSALVYLDAIFEAAGLMVELHLRCLPCPTRRRRFIFTLTTAEDDDDVMRVLAGDAAVTAIHGTVAAR